MLYENDFLNVKKWTEEFEDKILFCSGAIGDLFLGIDCAMRHNFSIIYWSKIDTFDISKKFLKAFNLNFYVINVGKEIWRDNNTQLFSNKLQEILKNRGYRTHCNNKCNLPLINFATETINKQYYDFLNYKLDIPEKYCLICPSGGNGNPKMRRYFHLDEFNQMICSILKIGIEPIIVGNSIQLKKFDNKKKYKWLQFEKFDNDIITVENFIETIRSSMFVISPDTSIKTLSAAMHVPTIVLKSRNINDQYINGPWDRVFLDKNKWKTLECLPFNEIIKKLNYMFPIKML